MRSDALDSGSRPGGRGRSASPSTIRTLRALVPVRFFFGATFLYAGLDKLLDPRFFDAGNTASIQAQMVGFARVSPIAPLVRLGEPFAVPIGFAIALVEMAIGLGAITGLAFRAAAWAGAFLSLLFFLTASWATRPYYYGADLPYAAGWIALGIAGHGGLFVSHRFLAWAGGFAGGQPEGPEPRLRGRGSPRRPAPSVSGRPNDDGLGLRDRRTVLQAGVLGVFALVLASLAVPLRRSGTGATGTTGATGPEGNPSSIDLPAASTSVSSPTAPSSAAPTALAVARVADLSKTGARAFTVPFSAPVPLPAGDPAIIVALADGSFVAFDAVCTHAGCTVQWDRADRLLYCPCHGATFDPADHAAVVGDGPTNQPLASIPIVVDGVSGTISLRA